jgi:hypothetical protein
MIDFVISVLIPSITIIAIVGTQLVLEGSTPTSAHFLLGPRLAVTALVLCISTTLLKLGENLTAPRVSAASELNLAYIHELNDLVQYKLGIMLGAIAVYVAQMVGALSALPQDVRAV